MAKLSVDMDAHTGLRGVAAVVLAGSRVRLPPLAAADELLQSSCCLGTHGHNIAVAPAAAAGKGTADGAEHAQLQQPSARSPYAAFMRNRLARVMPTYYLCALSAVPLAFGGYHYMDPADTSSIVWSIAVSVVPVCTLDGFLTGSDINSPGWTVCTLVVMWALFPASLARARGMSDAQLVAPLMRLYWAQLALALGLFFVLVPLLGFWPAFSFATMSPQSRYPVFLMGAHAGLLCLRHLHTPVPWPSSFLRFWPTGGYEGGGGGGEYALASTEQGASPAAAAAELGGAPPAEQLNAAGNSESARWARVTRRQCAQLSALTLAVIVADNALALAAGAHILAEVWLQAIVVFGQLELVVALARDGGGGAAAASRALRSRCVQWLGRVSMAVYLVHWPLIYYLAWALHGGALRPVAGALGLRCGRQRRRRRRRCCARRVRGGA
ncbi:hypothetical protein JKP88DRAFT_282226 [Tribonema minus]|uniref:Acyltransferase 3 domain-containing protein n=1 Tax=Tribonema minus TaxID=303371 RepID=A0A835YP55_9STRA|nr:hypothetical protein JKP88DRAFT_282226 [Tribonema minus]